MPSSTFSESRRTCLVGSAEDEVILREVGSELWTSMTGVVVQGNYAYCNMRFGLLILDISLPADGAKSLGFFPTYVSKVRLPGSTFDAAVSGDYVYRGRWRRYADYRCLGALGSVSGDKLSDSGLRWYLGNSR